MDVTTMNSRGSPQTVRRRRRGWLIAVAGVALWVALQSITITLPIHGRVVDETSGQPVPGAAVAAFWQLEAWTPVHVLPGGTVRIAQAVTNNDGSFEIPMALMVHLPLVPFSPLARTDSEMPLLIVVADRYHPQSAKNEGPGSGFLSLRTSTLQGGIVRLTPLPQQPDRRQIDLYRANLSWARIAVEFAVANCARRWLCRSDSLAQLRDVLDDRRARDRAIQAASP